MGIDVGIAALTALNDMPLAFLVWVPPRGYFAAMLATALGQAALFGLPPGSIRRDLLIAPGLLDATAFLAFDFFQADLRDVALITAVALAGIPKAEGEVGGSALAHLRASAWGNASANPGGIERKARRPRAMGLVEGSPLRRARRGHREAARGERPPIAAGRPGGGSL